MKNVSHHEERGLLSHLIAQKLPDEIAQSQSYKITSRSANNVVISDFDPQLRPP